jgi:hypothetical protein
MGNEEKLATCSENSSHSQQEATTCNLEPTRHDNKIPSTRFRVGRI